MIIIIVIQILPWLPSPDNSLRGLVVWPEPEVVESTVTLYKVNQYTYIILHLFSRL